MEPSKRTPYLRSTEIATLSKDDREQYEKDVYKLRRKLRAFNY